MILLFYPAPTSTRRHDTSPGYRPLLLQLLPKSLSELAAWLPRGLILVSISLTHSKYPCRLSLHHHPAQNIPILQQDSLFFAVTRLGVVHFCPACPPLTNQSNKLLSTTALCVPATHSPGAAAVDFQSRVGFNKNPLSTDNSPNNIIIIAIKQ